MGVSLSLEKEECKCESEYIKKALLWLVFNLIFVKNKTNLLLLYRKGWQKYRKDGKLE